MECLLLQYDFFIKSMNRLVEHPLSYRAKDFIMEFRKEKTSVKFIQEVPQVRDKY